MNQIFLSPFNERRYFRFNSTPDVHSLSERTHDLVEGGGDAQFIELKDSARVTYAKAQKRKTSSLELGRHRLVIIGIGYVGLGIGRRIDPEIFVAGSESNFVTSQTVFVSTGTEVRQRAPNSPVSLSRP